MVRRFGTVGGVLVLFGVLLLFAEVAWAAGALPPAFMDEWDLPGNPTGIAVDSLGDVYVLVPGAPQQVLKLDDNGALLAQWGPVGDGRGELRFPQGIAVGPGDCVYVADTGNSRILKFDGTGRLLVSWGSYGTGDNQFRFPCDIAVDSDGDVYVVDMGYTSTHPCFLTPCSSPFLVFGGPVSVAPRVRMFDKDGTHITTWGSFGTGAGQLRSPRGIAVDGAGIIYVTDSGNRRVERFYPWGPPAGSWGAFEFRSNEVRGYPAGIAVHADGRTFFCDSANHRVRVYDSLNVGALLFEWGSEGSGPGDFSRPWGIALDDMGHLYVADNGNARIQKYDYAVPRPPGPCAEPEPIFRYKVGFECGVPRDRPLASTVSGQISTLGPQSSAWSSVRDETHIEVFNPSDEYVLVRKYFVLLNPEDDAEAGSGFGGHTTKSHSILVPPTSGFEIDYADIAGWLGSPSPLAPWGPTTAGFVIIECVHELEVMAVYNRLATNLVRRILFSLDLQSHIGIAGNAIVPDWQSSLSAAWPTPGQPASFLWPSWFLPGVTNEIILAPLQDKLGSIVNIAAVVQDHIVRQLSDAGVPSAVIDLLADLYFIVIVDVDMSFGVGVAKDVEYIEPESPPEVPEPPEEPKLIRTCPPCIPEIIYVEPEAEPCPDHPGFFLDWL